MKSASQVSRGLRLVFISLILQGVMAATLWIPVLPVLVWVAFGILRGIGLWQSGKEAEGYRYALYAFAVNFLAALLGGFALASLMDAVALVFQMVEIYYICITTAELLRERQEEKLADHGERVWWGFLITGIGTFLTAAGIVISNGGALMVLGGGAFGLASLVVFVMLVVFTYQSGNRL